MPDYAQAIISYMDSELCRLDEDISHLNREIDSLETILTDLFAEREMAIQKYGLLNRMSMEKTKAELEMELDILGYSNSKSDKQQPIITA